jgi:hypothetical protein
MADGSTFSEFRKIRFAAGRRGHGPFCWLSRKPIRSHPHTPSGGKMLVDVNLLDEGHCSSSRSVACLNGARLERSLEG